MTFKILHKNTDYWNGSLYKSYKAAEKSYSLVLSGKSLGIMLFLAVLGRGAGGLGSYLGFHGGQFMNLNQTVHL